MSDYFLDAAGIVVVDAADDVVAAAVDEEGDDELYMSGLELSTDWVPGTVADGEEDDDVDDENYYSCLGSASCPELSNPLHKKGLHIYKKNYPLSNLMSSDVTQHAEIR